MHTDKIARYAELIQKMAHNAFMDTEDREALYHLAAEIQAERELELQERLVPSVDEFDFPMSAAAEDRLCVDRRA